MNSENGPARKRTSPPSSALTGRKAVGTAGEGEAARHLEAIGCQIVARNWRCRSGEIDLVVREGGTTIFVEVRSRTAPGRYGTAVESITPRKCRQVRDIAEIYLKMTGMPRGSIRFDVVAVTFGTDGAVADLRHIPGAF